MGVLLGSRSSGLESYGFKHVTSSVDGTLKDCYEKCVYLSDAYCAWVAVRPEFKEDDEVYIYVEYACGGFVASYSPILHHKYYGESQEFLYELDDYVTELAEDYA